MDKAAHQAIHNQPDEYSYTHKPPAEDGQGSASCSWVPA